jgi:uncharacterized protein YjbI with pentapeptide repeats
MSAELSVDFLNQPYLIDDTGHDAEMVDVLNLNPRLLSMFVHAPRISQLAGLTCGMRVLASGQYFLPSMFKGANLEGANLKGANLHRAEITAEQLAQCKSLEGATMPNGQKYERWLKTPDGQQWLKNYKVGSGENGENPGPS